MLKEKVLAKLEKAGVPLPTQPRKTDELFSLLPEISELSDTQVGKLHAEFSAWYAYISYLKMRAELDKMELESIFNKAYTINLLSVNHDEYKNVTERKAIAQHKTTDTQDKLQEAEASCIALETVTNNLEIGMKTISREISRRQFVYSAAHNLLH